MPRPKKLEPNVRLIELRKKTEIFKQIANSISEIQMLLRVIISTMEGELKVLEKRVCPKCEIIHSPYGTKRH